MDENTSLIVRAERRITGANVHAVRNLIQKYILLIDVNKINPNSDDERRRLARSMYALNVFADTGKLQDKEF